MSRKPARQERKVSLFPERASNLPSLESPSRYACETPIALFVFNRPELTSEVFARIAQARPARLFVIADAPRDGRPEEAARCEQVRAIATAVDWHCEVATDFADTNLGCRRRLVSGLDWLFAHVEEAIILEDDVLPEPSFFPFCEALLDRYRDEPRVAMIGGFSIVQDKFGKDAASYYFSHMSHIWGWATWRRAWALYDERLSDWPAIKASGLMNEIFPEIRHRMYWTDVFDAMHSGTGPNTWDIQWFYTNLMRSSLSVVPRTSLVENLGFGPEATHTLHAADNPCTPVSPMQFPLVHPAAMVPRHSLDRLDLHRSGCEPVTFARRVRNAIRHRIG